VKEMHPADDLRGTTSTKLAGTRILLAATGSIATVETVRLARELIRHGADVYPVMTPAATRILHPDALEFATGHHPVVQLTGQVEHVQWCGMVPDPVDLVLLPGCTANTISKIAHGIDDTPVTTCVTTALGSQIPVLIIPAMHKSMYTNKIVQHNLKTCHQAGITILEPRLEKTKARLPEFTQIIASVIRLLSSKDLAGKRLLIIGGATAEAVDDIRILTNRSSGKMAVALAQAAYEHGADVDLWYGHATQPAPPYATTTPFTTTHDLLTLVTKHPLTNYSGIILCAAIANYIPTHTKGKLPSGDPKLTITCRPAPKILEAIRTRAPNIPLIAFKAEETKTKVKPKTQQLMTTYKLQGAVGNTLTSFNADTAEILILLKNGKSSWKKGTKTTLANEILKSFNRIFTT
jgi:phosphopantothenoylcysteine decarboxylase / phosphopantothenate---cysteine ligase